MNEAQVDHEHEMDWRVTQLQAHVTELLEANNAYLERARAAELHSAMLMNKCSEMGREALDNLQRAVKAEAERDEAREALEPFAKATFATVDIADDTYVGYGLYYRDLRRARAAAKGGG